MDLRVLDFPNTLERAKLRRFFFLLLSISRVCIVTYAPSLKSSPILDDSQSGDRVNPVVFILSILPLCPLDEWHAERRNKFIKLSSVLFSFIFIFNFLAIKSFKT